MIVEEREEVGLAVVSQHIPKSKKFGIQLVLQNGLRSGTIPFLQKKASTADLLQLTSVNCTETSGVRGDCVLCPSESARTAYSLLAPARWCGICLAMCGWLLLPQLG